MRWALGFGDGWWLVDTGPRSPHTDAGEMAVLPFLRWAGVRRIERMALTHDDGRSHRRRPRRATRRSRRAHPHVAQVARSAGPAARFAGTGRIRTCARDDTLHAGPPVVVRWPPAGLAVRADNAASLVLEVGEGAGRVLLSPTWTAREKIRCA
jgi:beta-lactamase superfamily II metal-dependent hydrolase